MPDLPRPLVDWRQLASAILGRDRMRPRPPIDLTSRRDAEAWAAGWMDTLPEKEAADG